MATNNVNNKLIAYSGSVDCAPEKFTQLTGTMSTTGVFVYGNGTLFTTEIAAPSSGLLGSPSKVEPHGWLLNNTTAEVRRIKEVLTDTSLVLEDAFTANYNSTVKYIAPTRTKQWSYVLISGTVIVDGVTLASGEGGGFGDTSPQNVHTTQPVVIDSTSGVVHVNRFQSN